MCFNSQYLVEKYDMKRGKWEPVSEVKGTSFTVEKLLEFHEYKFRVLAANANGYSEPLETTKTVLAKDPFDVSSAPSSVECADRDKTFITVKWSAPTSDGGTSVLGYVVERKEPKGARWVKLMKRPVPETQFRDDTVKEGKSYEYRVLAFNKAGLSDPSKPSASFFARPCKGNLKIN